MEDMNESKDDDAVSLGGVDLAADRHHRPQCACHVDDSAR